ncbi:hypothetical protein LXL04_028235 [Taraxacum kok-saghyz]
MLYLFSNSNPKPICITSFPIPLKRAPLTGPIPDLVGLVNLKTLFLDHNSFTGAIPPRSLPFIDFEPWISHTTDYPMLFLLSLDLRRMKVKLKKTDELAGISPEKMKWPDYRLS